MGQGPKDLLHSLSLQEVFLYPLHSTTYESFSLSSKVNLINENLDMVYDSLKKINKSSNVLIDKYNTISVFLNEETVYLNELNTGFLCMSKAMDANHMAAYHSILNIYSQGENHPFGSSNDLSTL